MQAIGAGLVGVIENKGRAELAERGRAEAPGARHLQHGFLVQIVATEMLIEVEDHRIDLEEGRDSAVHGANRISGIDRVREVAGIAEALAVVKVGNREWEFLKLTPVSRTAAIAGAVSVVTIRPRNPSGTNRMMLCGAPFCANAVPAEANIRPAADSLTTERRMKISSRIRICGRSPSPLSRFARRRNCYIRCRTIVRQL